MRNAFVVLVSLCIGVTARFIGPSTVTENSLSSAAPYNTDEEVTLLKANSTVMPHAQTHVGELPNNRTNIDENALYEHAADKQNNQSERAFIYINQKYKKPSSLHNYFKIAQSGPDYSSRFLQPKSQAIVLQRHNEPCKSEPAHVNNLFQGNDFPIRTQDLSSYLGSSSSLFNCNNEPLNYVYRSNQQPIENFNAFARLSSEQRDYIELLKSPLLRPLGRNRPRYDGMPASRYPPVSSHDSVKLDRINKQHNSKPNILVDERKNDLQRNYGFNSAFSPQSPYPIKGLIQRVEEPHFDGIFVNDGEASQVASIEKAQDEDKLLDQYLKATLEDQVTSKEKPVNPNDCSYRDCIIQSTKTSSSAGRPKNTKNPECKCGQQIKQNEAAISRERQDREEYIRNKTNILYRPRPPQKPEVTYYATIMNDDPSNMKRGNELITKLNNTLYH